METEQADPKELPLRRKMAELEAIRKQRAERESVDKPQSYGLPDLLAPIQYLSEEKRHAIENERLGQFIESFLWFEKDGIRRKIKLIPEMLNFIADLFYQRTQFAILWKPRGGGGSLAAALVIWLFMVYRRKSWLDMAGSSKQAQVVYKYVSQFWDCVPGMEERLVKKRQITNTELANGAQLVCVACSEKQVRGEHRGGFCADESSQKDEGTNTRFEIAMQGVFSEADPVAMLASTFHHPFGFFQEYWDNAADKGFRRYKWDIFDSMQKCARGMEEARPEDPLALNYCRTKCPLTERREVKDEQGNVLDVLYEECAGKARHSEGFNNFENVLMAKKMNSAGPVWKIEFCCQRPRVRGHVYSTDRVEAACVKTVEWKGSGLKAVGLDWGLLSQAVAVMVCEADSGAVALEAKVFEGESADEIAQHLLRWKVRYGNFIVYADAEEGYGNQALTLAGLDVFPVHFGKWKRLGVDNLSLWLEYGKLKLLDDGDMRRVLIPQMKSLRRNQQTGKIRKVDDHGADALLCAMLAFDFLELAGNSMAGGLREKLEGAHQQGDMEITLV